MNSNDDTGDDVQGAVQSGTRLFFLQTKELFHDCERTVRVPSCESALTERHVSDFDNTSM